jgi:hypothetical protein
MWVYGGQTAIACTGINHQAPLVGCENAVCKCITIQYMEKCIWYTIDFSRRHYQPPAPSSPQPQSPSPMKGYHTLSNDSTFYNPKNKKNTKMFFLLKTYLKITIIGSNC